MSVVFVSPLFEVFSPTHSCSIGMVQYDLCRAAHEAGESPTIIARRSDRPTFDWPHALFVDYPSPSRNLSGWQARAERKIFGGKNRHDFVYVRRIAHAIAAQKLDRFPLIVHGHAMPAIWLRRRFPRAFIAFWCHGGLSYNAGERRHLKNAVDLAIGVSDFHGRWLQEFFGLSAERVATIYNGIDTELFAPARPSGSTPPVLTVTYSGRIDRSKGLDILLRAAVQAAPGTRPFQIVVNGCDQWVARETAAAYRSELQELERELEECGVKVQWRGHIARDAVPDALRASDIHVVPTRCDEAFGLSTVEAMACGAATIASRTGGTPEVVGEAALLFERENSADLARQLRALLESDALRREYSRRGRARALEFSRARMWRCLREIIPTPASGAA